MTFHLYFILNTEYLSHTGMFFRNSNILNKETLFQSLRSLSDKCSTIITSNVIQKSKVEDTTLLIPRNEVNVRNN